MFGTTLPTASNAIALNMVNHNSHLCNLRGPQWDYAAPTPDMEAKGLFPSKLQEILQQINNDADEAMTQHFNPNLKKLLFLPLIPLILLILGLIDFIGNINRFEIICGVATFICWICSFCIVEYLWKRAHQICVDQMKQYVEGELNEQWQRRHGIRWSIATTQVVDTHGTGSDRRISTKTLYHIQITSLTPAVGMTQQVPMQHMVQMQGMQGVPVNVQGQQMATTMLSRLREARKAVASSVRDLSALAAVAKINELQEMP